MGEIVVGPGGESAAWYPEGFTPAYISRGALVEACARRALGSASEGEAIRWLAKALAPTLLEPDDFDALGIRRDTRIIG